MRVLAWYVVIGSAIGVVGRLVLIVTKGTPRNVETTPLEDSIGMALNTAILVWAAFLLWG